MLSKWFWFPALTLAFGCRLGTPRPDGAEGPGAAAASSPAATASTPPAAAAPSASEAPRPDILLLPTAETAFAPALPAASAQPTPRRHRVVVLGDSLSDPRVGGGGYVAAIQRECAGAEVENLAKGGWMVNQMRRFFEADLAPRLANFDDLIVFGGVNDLYSDETAGRSFAKISADLTLIYRAAQAKRVRVIALTVTPWGGFSRYYNPRRAAATVRLNDWIRSQVSEGLVNVVVDANPLLTCGVPERLCPEYAAPFRDGIHFGKIGHQKLGALLVSQAFADCTANGPADR